MKKTKTFEFLNSSAGQKEKLKTIYKMEEQGWSIDREEIIPNSFSPCKGLILLIICFPLVLFGYDKGKVIITFVKNE